MRKNKYIMFTELFILHCQIKKDCYGLVTAVLYVSNMMWQNVHKVEPVGHWQKLPQQELTWRKTE